MAWLDRWRQYICNSPQPTARQSCTALPRNLKRLREARGWTINQLAVASHVSESTIREIEANDRGFGDVPQNPTLSTLLKLARALGVGVEALVEEGHGESL